MITVETHTTGNIRENDYSTVINYNDGLTIENIIDDLKTYDKWEYATVDFNDGKTAFVNKDGSYEMED